MSWKSNVDIIHRIRRVQYITVVGEYTYSSTSFTLLHESRDNCRFFLIPSFLRHATSKKKSYSLCPLP
jgi:hypothetical protein